MELQRDPALYPHGNVIEWRRPADFVDTDGFEIKRAGDQEVKCLIHIYIDHRPARYKLHPDLAALLNIQIETRPGVLMALWNYIKTNRLQSPSDRTVINNNAALQKVRVSLPDRPSALTLFIARFLACRQCNFRSCRT